MMRRFMIAAVVGVVIISGPAGAQSRGDARRGAELYRACIGCHSLEPGSHLTGPSLAGLWGRKAGALEDFVRYSRGLSAAQFTWNEATLEGWLYNPQGVVPDTYMSFRGVENAQARADLIAFLAVATAPGGAKTVVDRKLAPYEYVRGQAPGSLARATPDVQVMAIRHCADSYFITSGLGVTTPYWEMNVRLKVDSRSTGPQPGRPVILRAGMAGDRVSIVFSSVRELGHFVVEKCEG